MKLRFINHASYIIESSKSLLLHDPWLEGNAFNNGWSLLSKTISNQDLIDYLSNSQKHINIWISHEHSDHFSISFIKLLKKTSLNCSFFFQKTADKRVFNYLKANNFDVTECIDGREYKLDKNFFLSVYNYAGGDSFCFVRTDQKNILNINDCVIRSESQAMKVISRLPKNVSIDVLFTQFGYANWIGRPEDHILRKKSSEEKFIRILIQNNVFNPEIIIPFASFVYFCKEDNFYMNDEQNFPNKLRKSNALEKIQEKINFMMPNQEVILDKDVIGNLRNKTAEAEQYWDSYEHLIKDSNYIENGLPLVSVTEDSLIEYGKKYFSGVRNHTLWLVTIFEYLKMFNLKPINLNIYDLDINLRFSYISGISKSNQDSPDISIHSSEVAFILKNEFGWNTLCVSGAFRACRDEVNSLNSFFRWQDAIKNGFSFKNPWYSLKVSIRYFYNRLIKSYY